MAVTVATAITALNSARSYLNDVNAVTWSDARLFPILQEAHRELSAELVANGIGLVREQANIITVLALPVGTFGPVDLPNIPTNLLIPIELLERDVGADVEDFIRMQQTDFVPTVDPTSNLLFWSWLGQRIQLVGSTADREVLLRFRGNLVQPSNLNDTLGLQFAELYIGPRIAAIAMPERDDLAVRAATNLNTVIRYNVVGEQGVPKRKMGYRRGGYARRRIF